MAAVLLVVGGLLLGRSSVVATATAVPESPAALALADLTPTATPAPAETPPSAPGVPPTSTPLPTYTAAPIATMAAPPPISAPGGMVATTVPGQLTPTSHPTIAAPVLEEPLEGAIVYREASITFKWRWEGTLPEGLGFDVRIWQESDPDHFGAFDARELSKYLHRQSDGMYVVSFLVDGAYSVHLHGGGDYLWTVAVVRPDPYAKIGLEAPPRRLKYVIPAPGQTRGGSNSGGKGEPPPPGN
jgi:hypothetical protein